MKLHSLRSKLVISISALVIGSGAVISLLETRRFSTILHEAAITQGEYISKAVALEAINKILINDLISLQNLLNYQRESNPAIAYLFILKDSQILAHTFAEGIPRTLIQVNLPVNKYRANYKYIVDNDGERYLDFAAPIFAGKAGVLRIGLSEKPLRSQVLKLWLQMTGLTLGILFLALFICFFFIRRITRPLSGLAEAAENLAENVEGGALELNLVSAGRDEVGRLTTAINRLLDRIREYTQRLEKNAQEVDRAHWQTKNSFEIIKKIWEQDRLKDVCQYLIWKFQKIVACKELVLYIFGSNKENFFAFFNGEFRTFRKQDIEKVLPLLTSLEGFTFVKKNEFDADLLPDAFQSSNHVATFPIHHENQILGALLIPCPGDCNCQGQELGIVNLVLNHSSRAIKHAVSHEEEMLNLRSRIEMTTEYCGIVGKDPEMQTIYKLIEDIAPTDTSVLIQGESGTGKELVARALHRKSLRREEPFIVINCSAYPSTLLESELFGHEKGAFTGAVRQKTGRFEQAHGGTVFLDEIGEIPSSAQIKLLRVLQTQKFERVGGEKTLFVNVRIIAATNKDLLKEVRQGTFREDLYYRLNVIPLHLPPLRNRPNDIPLQARYFLHRFASEQDKNIAGFGSETMRRLLLYHWPGNVRELENCIEHAVVLTKGPRIEVHDLPVALQKADHSGGNIISQGSIVENEMKLLEETLNDCNWNKKEAARRLGISRNTLYRKLRKYGISPPTLH